MRLKDKRGNLPRKDHFVNSAGALQSNLKTTHRIGRVQTFPELASPFTDQPVFEIMKRPRTLECMKVSALTSVGMYDASAAAGGACSNGREPPPHTLIPKYFLFFVVKGCPVQVPGNPGDSLSTVFHVDGPPAAL